MGTGGTFWDNLSSPPPSPDPDVQTQRRGKTEKEGKGGKNKRERSKKEMDGREGSKRLLLTDLQGVP